MCTKYRLAARLTTLVNTKNVDLSLHVINTNAIIVAKSDVFGELIRYIQTHVGLSSRTIEKKGRYFGLGVGESEDLLPDLGP